MDSQHKGGESKPERYSLTQHIDLAELEKQARTSSKKELVRLIEEHQERLMEELCGPTYSWGHPYRRGGTYTKRLVTSLGEIGFKVRKIVRRSDGEARSRPY